MKEGAKQSGMFWLMHFGAHMTMMMLLASSPGKKGVLRGFHYRYLQH
jgi:hypothetical protein